MEKNFGVYNWNRKYNVFGLNIYFILWYDVVIKAVLMKYFFYGFCNCS